MKMSQKQKEIALNLGSGLLVGLMFNVAFNVGLLNSEGIIGGLIVGYLMYAL
jgi:hypothetical protein